MRIDSSERLSITLIYDSYRATERHGREASTSQDGKAGHKKMQTSSPDTSYRDITEHIQEEVATDNEGKGDFRCRAGSVSVWVPVKE